MTALPSLAGSVEVLGAAKTALAGAPLSVLEAIEQLEQIIEALTDADISIYLDLGEMPGYHYHTGVVFAAYVQGYGKALGNGGRYDHVGEAFGRARPATGFAFDLKSLVTQGCRGTELRWAVFLWPLVAIQNCISRLRCCAVRAIE